MKNEAEVGAGIVQWLEKQNWDVYQEVKYYGGIADIVAVNGNLVWAIECKKSLTLSVMEQARGWRTHLRSVAIPRTKRRDGSRRTAYLVAKNYFKVGVIEVDRLELRDEIIYRVDVKAVAPLMREHHKFAKKFRLEGLVPEQKVMAKAGTKHGDYYTPYKGSMARVRRFIGENPGCTLKMIMDELGKMHYMTDASARSTIPKNLLTIESECCRVDKSKRPHRFYIKES